MFEIRKIEKGQVLTLLMTDFPVDDLECQEDEETQIIAIPKPLPETLSTSPTMVNPPFYLGMSHARASS